ncbi:MAG: BNR-4 repeat-containing protein [Lewinella sp.]
MFRCPLLFLLLLSSCAAFQAQESGGGVALVSESLIAEDGLFFYGKKGEAFQFGPQISAHGDCIAVVGSFTFVTWYRGGTDKRNLMLSRRRNDDPAAAWVTLEFPDKHIGYRGDSTLGDSHNTAAVAVSTIDSTVHLLYDMHAYDARNFPDHYFNYRVTEKGAAFVPDAEFTLDRFLPKRNYLVEGQPYEKTTYPGFLTDPDGRLIVGYRLGGSGQGEHQYAVYDATGWNKTLSWANGRIPLPDRYSVYGSLQIEHGKLHAGYSIRYKESDRYTLNSGLYYAYALPPYGAGDWYDVNDRPISTPIGKADALQVADPGADYGSTPKPRSSSGPAFTVTEAGDIHFLTRVDDRSVHYWRKAGESVWQHAADGEVPGGAKLTSYGNTLVAIDLADGRLRFKTAPAGTNDWRTVYVHEAGPRFHHFRTAYDGGRVYAYGQEAAGKDARPLYLQVFDLGDAIAAPAPN